MNKTVNVSVVIPNYNHEIFLEQRITSVLNQTYQNFEIILLDDASTDESKNILNKYRNHPKVSQIVYNDENSGSVFKQWIKGIQLAQGEYLWIAESDDYADERFLEITVKSLENNHKLGMVFTDSLKVDKEGQTLGLVSKSKTSINSLVANNNIINETNCAKYLLQTLVIVNASSVLFRRKTLLNLNFEVLQTLKNMGDVFVYLGVALNYDAYFLSEQLNYMRLHSANTTKKNKKSGQIYKDKIILLDTYCNDLSHLETGKQEVVNFLLSFIFLSIDYGHIDRLKLLVKKMFNLHFIDRRKYLVIKSVIFYYNYFMFKGRPQFLREWLKSVLKKIFK